ncbi:MAG: quinone oxidoreductase [Deltaproteobacteria bacterium]|nr:quinone oxidoreductase [Deltaproteobacteria bacterium]
MKTMAIQVRAVGGPDVLVPTELELADPGPGQARLRVERIGVNFIDTYHRTGHYPLPLPFVPGVEAAGVVEAIGEGVREVAVGERAAFAMVPGSYAEACLVPAAKLVRLPAGLSVELAAASLLQGMTAHYLTHGVRTTRPGDTALVHAAAGGTGGLLVQTLKAAGARVIATCSSEAKAELARAAGADEVVLYGREDFRARARAFGDGRGVDVVYDSVGQSTFEGSLGSLRPRGLLCLFGQSSGAVAPFDLARLSNAGSLFVTRPGLAHYVATRAELEERAGWVFESLATGRLKQSIGGRHPLREAARAHRDLEGRGTTGKLVLVPS